MVQRESAGSGKERSSVATGQTMSAPQTIKAECPFCGQRIEVTAEIATDWITCPNEACGRSFPPIAKKPGAPPREFVNPPANPTTSKPPSAKLQPSKPYSAVLLDIGAVLLLGVGCVMVADGCNAAASEQHPEAGAIRQITATVEAGLGVVVISLSLILAALVRIIRKP